jgi:4'-phosphopantetheinyl transferase
MIETLPLTQQCIGPIELWWGDVSHFLMHQDYFYSTLNAEEQTKAQRFVTSELSSRYIIAHGLLRELLAHYLQKTPEAITFERSPQGKPFIKDCSLSFNLSHARDGMLFGFSRQTPVGVDIEFINREELSALSIAQRYFHPKEFEALQSLTAEEQISAFYQVWTQKEAVLKAMGVGIAHHLATCEVSVLPTEPARLISFEGQQQIAQPWQLHRFTPLVGYTAAVAFKNI